MLEVTQRTNVRPRLESRSSRVQKPFSIKLFVHSVSEYLRKCMCCVLITEGSVLAGKLRPVRVNNNGCLISSGMVIREGSSEKH